MADTSRSGLARFIGIAAGAALLAAGIHLGLGWRGTWFWGPLSVLLLAVVLRIIKFQRIQRKK